VIIAMIKAAVPQMYAKEAPMKSNARWSSPMGAIIGRSYYNPIFSGCDGRKIRDIGNICYLQYTEKQMTFSQDQETF
jgi:hypothetical protein